MVNEFSVGDKVFADIGMNLLWPGKVVSMHENILRIKLDCLDIEVSVNVRKVVSDRPELREFFVCQLDDIRDSAREQWDNVYRKIRENRRSNDN